MRHAMIPKYILTPNLGFLPQIIYRHALGSTLLELKPGQGHSDLEARAQDVSTYQILNCFHK